MRRLITLSWLALAVPALAGVSERTFERAIDLVDRLYLYPDELEPDELLEAAARSLADEVDWLLVAAEGGEVSLRHGDGTPLGSVTVDELDALPEALLELESLVVESGYDLEDVDVRLEILKGTTDALDRYSKILTGERLDKFDVRLKGTLVGIGATLHLSQGGLRVKALVSGGPAELGGVLIGDIIQRIDGTSTVNMPLKEAVRRIRGEVDTPVTLTVLREGEVVSLTLTRAEVVVPNVMHEVLPGPVAYLRITHFSQQTVANLVLALDELRVQGALSKGLIIDLRGNTGGSMKEAARSADQFLTDGMLLRTAGPDGGRVQNLQARMDATDSGSEPPIPIVVLVDRRTASGSEILAGALLELDRAAIVGSRTYGKGTVQKIYNLDEGTRLKLTVAQYLLADDRSIAEDGLVPDVVLGRVSLDGYGVRYHGWHEDQAGVAFERILPVVDEDEGWRGTAVDPGDVPRELARRALLRALGPERRDVLLALDAVVREVRTEQEAALDEALEARGIDWSVRDTEAGPLSAAVSVRSTIDSSRPDVMLVDVEVHNQGTRPLSRALVQLECDTFSAWDGLVVPVGQVEPGDVAGGEVAVPLRPGVHRREDAVSVLLRGHRAPTFRAGEAVLFAESSSPPRLAVTAQLDGSDSDRRAEVTLRNLSSVPLTGVEVSFAHPGDLDVELLDASALTPVLGPRAESRLDLSLRVGPDAPEVLPLTLMVEGERYPRLLTWPVQLDTGGRAVSLEAPRIEVHDQPLSAPVGPFVLPVRVVDEREVDHVVVYANGEKVAWAGGGRSRVDLRATVELEPGVNRLITFAEDDQGVRSRRQVVVRGTQDEAAVDAGTE